jgi:DNA polymerase-1
LSPNELQEVKKRVQRARKDHKDQNKTLSEQIDELLQTLKNPSEKDLYYMDLAKNKLLSGETDRLRDGKISKSELIEIGKTIERYEELKKKRERAKKVIESKPDNYFILRDDRQLPQFLSRLREECRLQRVCWKDLWKDLGVESLVAIDYEGTGTDWFKDLSIGLAVWLPILDEGYYLPYGHVFIDELDIDFEFKHKPHDKQLTRSEVIKTIKPYMEAETEGKTAHMGAPRYDLHVAKNDGIEVQGLVFDSHNAMFLLNEHEESYGLKNLIKKYGRLFGIDHEIYTFEDLFGNGSPAPYDIELVGIYAINDVYYGWKLTEWQITMLQNIGNLWKCYCRIDKDLPETDFFIQRCGFDVDFEALGNLEHEFEGELKRAKQSLFTAYNIDSSFIDKMSRTINKHKIKKWQEDQGKRIQKWEERKVKLESELAKLESARKTHLKKYTDMKSQLEKHMRNKPDPPTVENYPDHIQEFVLTNRNHIGYLIYDHLRIKDITPSIEVGKERSTGKGILEKYFEQHDSLKPLKRVSELEKLLSTYIRSFPNSIDFDGKLHSMFDSCSTSTGRYSSKSYSGRPVE